MYTSLTRYLFKSCLAFTVCDQGVIILQHDIKQFVLTDKFTHGILNIFCIFFLAGPLMTLMINWCGIYWPNDVLFADFMVFESGLDYAGLHDRTHV